ncbi:hypothetical protein ADK77_16870, partial [Streptomyces antibioticus]
MLLLDEPTAALDGGTEGEVVAAVRRLAAGRTVVLVVHRPALLGVADRVVRLGGTASVPSQGCGGPTRRLRPLDPGPRPPATRLGRLEGEGTGPRLDGLDGEPAAGRFGGPAAGRLDGEPVGDRVRGVEHGAVRRALRDAGAWEFVAALPDGVDTVLGEDGAGL